MRLKKTASKNRNTYTYYFADGTTTTLVPGENGITEMHIKMLHSMDDAEVYQNLKQLKGAVDVVQYKKEKEEYEKEHGVGTYPFELKYNVSMDAMGTNEDGDDVIDHNMKYAQPEGDNNTLVKLCEPLVKQMPQNWQEIYNASFIEGKKNVEIAKERNVSEAAIRKTLSKIIEKLKESEEIKNFHK